MRLFLWFSNTVFQRLKRFFIHHKTYSICWTSRHRKRGEMTFKKWPPKKAFCSNNNIMTWEVNCLDISSLLSHSLESHIQLAVPSSELLLIKRRSGSRMPCFDFLFDWFSDISFHRILRNGFETQLTVFENHRKSLIWQSLNCGQTALPDMSE